MQSYNEPVSICDGELEIVKITEDLYDDTVKLFKNHFMKNENICTVCNLLDSEQSIKEMEILLRNVLVDRISFAARHCQTKEIVAFCANKMLCPDTENSLAAVCVDFRSPGMICVLDYLERVECGYDLFKEWNIDCAMELVFLSTHTDFVGRGLATILSKYSINYARQMLEGILSDEERAKLPAHVRDLRPKAICSVFTSYFSQKVGKRLGMETVLKIPNTEFSFEGKTFAEKLDPIHAYAVFAAMKL